MRLQQFCVSCGQPMETPSKLLKPTCEDCIWEINLEKKESAWYKEVLARNKAQDARKKE